MILRLLIVEDEKQICDAIAKSLYDAGYEAVSYTHLDVYKRQDHLREMLIFANAGAALVTTKKGAICSMPERREIVDLIDVGRNAIHQF